MNNTHILSYIGDWPTFIINNFDELITLSNEFSPPLYVWKNFADTYPSEIKRSDEIMKGLLERGMLKKEYLSLFASRFCTLNYRVYLRDMKVDKNSLGFICDKEIKEMEILNVTGVHLGDLVELLAEFSQNTLMTLNVTGIDLDRNSVESLTQFGNLISLNLSHTGLDNDSLESLSDVLTNIQLLDISCTKVTNIQCLRKWKRNLKNLNLRNLSLDESTVSILASLENLEVLDVSTNGLMQSSRPNSLESFIASNSLPKIKELDLSGNSFQLSDEEIL